MNKATIQNLSSKICSAVGEKEFRLENKCPPNKVCGQVRLAIGLWLLFGGSYLDLVGRSYGLKSMSSINTYFESTINWINKTFDFESVGLLQRFKNGDLAALAKLKEISSDFAVDSDMVFNGCIGAIDGLAVRIKCPTEVRDPGNYFCHKNFYALNVQAICDREKRCLWISPGHQGASHDSFAWSETKLYNLLQEMKDSLKEHGLFLVGGSAYPMSAFLLAPYDNATPNSPEDLYNFWHSNSRIRIECLFGEIVMRCGLLSAALLHNFLVDSRENRDVEQMETDLDDDLISWSSEDELLTFPLVTDNSEPAPTGRKTSSAIKSDEEGKELRKKLCNSLLQEGKIRPMSYGMKYSGRGLVYFEN
eukprot:CCRYP_020357-RA/>CCRYP_020357-RA protein AED:0.12 eAED:0.12 QI:0/0/0/1/1/1/2/0/362